MSARKPHNFNKRAGCIKIWTNRKKQIVGVYDGLQSGIEDNGWATVCEKHSTCVISDDRETAIRIAKDTTMWCEECRENKP